MSRNTFYIQSCSTCGRKLYVRVIDLGNDVLCKHCGAEFIACDPHGESAASLDSVSHWIEAADKVLGNQSFDNTVGSDFR